jgi:hypothetical protein
MIRVVHPGSRIRMLTFYPSRIPDPGVKKAPDPGSGSATLLKNTNYAIDFISKASPLILIFLLVVHVATVMNSARQLLYTVRRGRT